MPGLQEEVAGLLPTRATRLVALATAPLAAGGFYLPHHLSPLWPTSTQAEIVLAQILVPALIGLVGALTLLVLVLRELHRRTRAHEAEMAAAAEEKKKLTERQTSNAPRMPAVPKRLDDFDRKLLLYLAERDSASDYNMREHMNALRSVLELHLHDLDKAGFIGPSSEGKWMIRPEGTRRLIEVGALKR